MHVIMHARTRARPTCREWGTGLGTLTDAPLGLRAVAGTQARRHAHSTVLFQTDQYYLLACYTRCEVSVLLFVFVFVFVFVLLCLCCCTRCDVSVMILHLCDGFAFVSLYAP